VDPVSAMSDSDASAISSPAAPRGVGGWLLYFIFTVVFFSPADHVLGFLRSYHHTIELFASAPHLYARYQFYIVEQLAGFALNGYGIFAGIQLWKTKPAAVMHAKRFLLLFAAYHLVVFAMTVNFAGIMDPPGWLRTYMSHALPRQGLYLVYPTIWYCYLLRSKRVRNTFCSETNKPQTAALTQL
jgi:Protein of unknown function (DUF2569)